MLLIKLVQAAKWFFQVGLLLYVAINWLKLPENKWTALLRRVFEPILTPIRAILVEKLPPAAQILDWSPVAAWLLAELVCYLLNNLFSIFI